MTIQRRTLLRYAALLPAGATTWGFSAAAAAGGHGAANEQRLILSDFRGSTPYYLEGSGWRGFTDRVMGGQSDAAFGQDVVGGKTCVRMTADVTRKSNGGFAQMAMYFGQREAELDASAFRGIEMLVHGNNEDYNVHVRTADCGWYDESYRTTIFVTDEWQSIRIPWDDFSPNGLDEPLDTARINRIAILGWMREFKADIALAEIALYS